MRPAWMLSAALLSAALVLGARPLPLAADDGPHVVFDAADKASASPQGQGVTVERAEVGGRPAAKLAVGGGTAWARIWLRNVPADITPYATLTLEWSGDTAQLPLEVHLSDKADRVATMKVGAPHPGFETRRLVLGDLAPAPGFDPAQVASLALVWFKPAAPSTLALAKVELLRGPGGWRLGAEALAAKVFGEKRAKDVKHESTAHFELWSDSAKALKPLGEALEAEAEAAARLLGVGAEALKGFTLPVFGFKSPGDYREYCSRTYGWNEEQVRRRPVAATPREIVMHLQDGASYDRRMGVAKAVFAYAVGPGGGAWLQEGAGEFCARSIEGRNVTKEVAPRVKSGPLWALKSLVVAESLYGTATSTDATYDYRPLFLHAASVVEFLLRRPPAAPAPGGAAPEGQTPADRVRERLKALAAVRAAGAARVAGVEQALGTTLAAFEAEWKAWALSTGK